MLKKLKTYFIEGYTYTGLEISQAEDSRVYYVLEVKKANNELVLVHKKECCDLEEVRTLINTQHPVFLCINTSGVLAKKVGESNSTNPEALVNKAFPNLDLDNFYFEVSNKDNTIVTISKKEAVDSLLKELEAAKIKIAGFSLGISSLENVVPYLEDGLLSIPNHQISISNKSIGDITPTQVASKQKYMINGLQLRGHHVLPFSMILGHLNQHRNRTNFGAVSQDLLWGFKNDRIFKQVLKISLSFFVVLLLGNFFVYNFYHEEVGSLNAAITATSSQKDELTLLDASVLRKQERVETLSASSNSKATYYLDLFAQNIPTSILLDELKYQPLAKPIREKKPVLLEEKVLLISGISKDVNEFSFWIENLEKQEWVNAVETLDYDYISKNTSRFLIEIEFNAMSHED